MALTAKQARFVSEYLIDLNATQAAIRAGYSKKSAEDIGRQLLRKTPVAAAIRERQAAQLQRSELTAAATLEAIRRQVCRDVRRLFDDRGNVKPLHQLSAEDASMIAGFEIVIKNAEAGDGATDRVLKVRLQDQGRFVDLAARHFALLVERVQVDATDALIAKLLEGRRRAAERSRLERGQQKGADRVDRN